MAESLGVNNVTIVSAYKYLETKKIVYSQVGSGTFVSPIPLESIPSPITVSYTHLDVYKRQIIAFII